MVKKVCEYSQVTPAELKQKGRQNKISIAKGLICYWGTQYLGLSSTEVLAYLGISQPAVSMANKRGAEYCQQQGIEWERFLKDSA